LASFKINFATCKGLGDPKDIVAAMEGFGLAETEEIGVLHASAAPGAAFGTLVRRTNLAVQVLDAKTREVVSRSVERVTLLPFGAFPKTNRLEVYAGGGSAIKEVSAFLSSGLAMPVVSDFIELDLLSAVESLAKETPKFQLRGIRVSDYAANSYMIGPYAPKFMDTDHGLKFLQEYAEVLKTVQVRFAGPSGRATATLTPNACFSYACSNEDDQPHVQKVLRKLAGG
jgi:hypothetical protein